MANALWDQYRERGVLLMHVVIDDGTGDGVVTWADAQKWAYGMDFNGDGKLETLKFPVIADTDGALWRMYIQPCGSDIFCQYTCYVTPQVQIFDQGLVTVDDGCSVPAGGNTCSACGYSESRVKSVLDSILPPVWCGEATP